MADSVGDMIGNAKGEVAAAGAGQGRRDVFLQATGSTLGRGYESLFEDDDD